MKVTIARNPGKAALHALGAIEEDREHLFEGNEIEVDDRTARKLIKHGIVEEPQELADERDEQEANEAKQKKLKLIQEREAETRELKRGSRKAPVFKSVSKDAPAGAPPKPAASGKSDDAPEGQGGPPKFNKPGETAKTEK